MFENERTTNRRTYGRAPSDVPGRGDPTDAAMGRREDEEEAPERVYPNGAPTYTTSTSVPGDRPWAGTVHPSVAEGLSADAIDRVQHLIELNIDSVRGWETAADAVDSAPLKARFRAIAEQRRGFAEELQSLVRRAGQTPESSGTTAGSLHRWWLNLRASVGATNTRIVLEEAERGEDAIKHGYEAALRGGALGGLARMVSDEALHVRRVHDEVRALRDEWRART